MDIHTVIADTSNIYVYCGLFILFEAGILLTKIYPEFVSTREAAVIVKDDFDCCGRTDNGFHFCKSCYNIIIKEKILKFGSANCINVLACQKYPKVLSDLTPVKEAFIVCAHPVILIIKLRSSSSGFSFSYH